MRILLSLLTLSVVASLCLAGQPISSTAQVANIITPLIEETLSICSQVDAVKLNESLVRCINDYIRGDFEKKARKQTGIFTKSPDVLFETSLNSIINRHCSLFNPYQLTQRLKVLIKKIDRVNLSTGSNESQLNSSRPELSSSRPELSSSRPKLSSSRPELSTRRDMTTTSPTGNVTPQSNESADVTAQMSTEVFLKGLNSLNNPDCFDAEAAAVDTVKTVIKAVPVLAGVNTISGGILYKVIDKVISVETLRAVKEDPNVGAVVKKLVLNDPEIKALTDKRPSLDGIKNLAGGAVGKITGGFGRIDKGPFGPVTDQDPKKILN